MENDAPLSANGRESTLTFRPSLVTLLVFGFLLMPVTMLFYSWTTSLIVFACSAGLARWFYSVRIENGDVIGPSSVLAFRRTRIPIAHVVLGPPPDYMAGYTLASDCGPEQMTTIYLGKESRARLSRVIGLEGADGVAS